MNNVLQHSRCYSLKYFKSIFFPRLKLIVGTAKFMVLSCGAMIKYTALQCSQGEKGKKEEGGQTARGKKEGGKEHKYTSVKAMKDKYTSLSLTSSTEVSYLNTAQCNHFNLGFQSLF